MFDAIVLAGGSGSRLGGIDKAAVVIDGSTMLDRVLDATREASTTVVVGPHHPTQRVVSWTRESPVGGGPVAGLAAGLALTNAELVAVVAVDLPHLGSDDLVELAGAASNRDGAILVDGDGRDQFLAGVYSAASLRAAMRRLTTISGVAMHEVVRELDLARVVNDRAAQDCDTPDDLRTAEAFAKRR